MLEPAVRDADWVWTLNDFRDAPHVYAHGLVTEIARARRDGEDVGVRVRAALEFVADLVHARLIRPAGHRAEPRPALEQFADAVERLPAARQGKGLAERKHAHEALERLSGELVDQATQRGERLKRPRLLKIVALSEHPDENTQRLTTRIGGTTDVGELTSAWRLTAKRQRVLAAQAGPASEQSLALTRGLEALTQRFRALGIEPPTVSPGRDRGR